MRSLPHQGESGYGDCVKESHGGNGPGPAMGASSSAGSNDDAPIDGLVGHVFGLTPIPRQYLGNYYLAILLFPFFQFREHLFQDLDRFGADLFRQIDQYPESVSLL